MFVPRCYAAPASCIETKGGVMTKLIEQHHHPDQTVGDLHHGRRQPAVGADPGHQGEREIAAHKQAARQLRVDRHPAGSAQRAPDRGDLRHRRQHRHVTAKDKGTGKENTIKIQEGSGLSKEEIDRMIKDAEAHADEDRKRREEADVRNQAESLVYQTEKFVKEQREAEAA